MNWGHVRTHLCSLACDKKQPQDCLLKGSDRKMAQNGFACTNIQIFFIFLLQNLLFKYHFTVSLKYALFPLLCINHHSQSNLSSTGIPPMNAGSHLIPYFTTRTAPTSKASLCRHRHLSQKSDSFSQTEQTILQTLNPNSKAETSYLVDAVTPLESERLPVISRCTTAGLSTGFSVPSSGSSSDCSSFTSSSSSKRSFI